MEDEEMALGTSSVMRGNVPRPSKDHNLNYQYYYGYTSTPISFSTDLSENWYNSYI